MNKCVSAIFKKDDRYLMLFHKNLNALSTVGGKVEKNEDVLSAIKREIKEEVGLTVTDNNLFLCNIQVSHADKYGNYILFSYLVNDWENSDEKQPENVEFEKHSLLDWYTVTEIKQFKKITTSSNVILTSNLALDEFQKYMVSKNNMEVDINVEANY